MLQWLSGRAYSMLLLRKATFVLIYLGFDLAHVIYSLCDGEKARPSLFFLSTPTYSCTKLPEVQLTSISPDGILMA